MVGFSEYDAVTNTQPYAEDLGLGPVEIDPPLRHTVKELRQQARKCKQPRAAAILSCVAAWLDGFHAADKAMEPHEFTDAWVCGKLNEPTREDERDEVVVQQSSRTEYGDGTVIEFPEVRVQGKVIEDEIDA